MLWARRTVVTGVDDLTVRSISPFVYGRVIESTARHCQYRYAIVSNNDRVAVRRICVFQTKVVRSLGQAVLLSTIFRVAQVYDRCSWACEQGGRADEVGNSLCSNQLEWRQEQEPGDNVEGTHCG
jgi:hypothetical protein